MIYLASHIKGNEMQRSEVQMYGYNARFGVHVGEMYYLYKGIISQRNYRKITILW